MGKLVIDKDALVAHLQQQVKDSEESEIRCAEGARYEYAQKFRERKFIFKTLLTNIKGGEHDKPFMVADGGFMVEVEDDYS